MNSCHISTIRHRTHPIVLVAGCALLLGCSSQNKQGWFQFGNADPEPVQEKTGTEESTENQEASPSEVTQEPPATPELESNQPIAVPPESTRVSAATIDEVVALYRRLHVEMSPDARSALIVELLNDSRLRVCRLGFELASRDLSSGAKLSNDTANAAVELLDDTRPTIRSDAARLITRLALPDAMTLLTDALSDEQDPLVAEALLLGLDRWPNPDAREQILHWYQSETSARSAAANAAWGIADLGLWDLETQASQLRAVYRMLPNEELTQADLKLIAATGTHADLERLVLLASDPVYPSRMNAAEALVYNPAGVDSLLALASEDPTLSPAAALAIETNRLNPQGIARLAQLEWSDDNQRTQAILNACNLLDIDLLADAVRLARSNNALNDSLSIRILNRLTAGTQGVSPRVAPGVVMLAELELQNQRPDRALEIISLLPIEKIDPDSVLKSERVQDIANILLTQFDSVNTPNPDPWFSALSIASDQSIRVQIANELNSRNLELSKEQQDSITAILSASVQDSARTPP